MKLFPADISGGPVVVGAPAAPFCGVKFVPTGGVSLVNLVDYLAVGSVAAVDGSWMVPIAAIRASDFETVPTLTAEAVALVKEGVQV